VLARVDIAHSQVQKFLFFLKKVTKHHPLFICICHSKVFLKYSQEDFDKEYIGIGIDSYLKSFLEIISVSETVFLKVGKSKKFSFVFF